MCNYTSNITRFSSLKIIRGVPVELFVTGTGIFGENFADTGTGIFRATCVVFFCTKVRTVNEYSSRSLKVPARAAKCSLAYSPLYRRISAQLRTAIAQPAALVRSRDRLLGAYSLR